MTCLPVMTISAMEIEEETWRRHDTVISSVLSVDHTLKKVVLEKN